jgi:hypothetical protein
MSYQRLPKMSPEAVNFLICIRDIFGTNLDLGTYYTDLVLYDLHRSEREILKSDRLIVLVSQLLQFIVHCVGLIRR